MIALSQSVNPKRARKKKRGAWQTHTRLPTNKSIFRVPQGSPPYRHSMSIPYYKSSSADSVKPAQLTLSHHRTERLSFAAALFLSEERSPALWFSESLRRTQLTIMCSIIRG